MDWLEGLIEDFVVL